MESWYREKLKAGEKVLLSESGFTSDELALEYLQHFIRHTGATPGGPFKLLLMDNHGSHRTPQFILLAHRHHIILFSFPAHMSHCMQPLDVGCFQAEKHWHAKAISYALDNLDFDYSIASFLRDLPEIRTKTFQKLTIRDAFRHAGMWPPSFKIVEEKMAKYVKSTTTPARITETLPLPDPQTPKTARQVERKLQKLKSKVNNIFSSPSRAEFDSFQRGAINLLDEGELVQFERDTLYQRLEHHTKRAPHNKNRLQRGGQLTGEYAQELIRQKDQKRAEKEAKVQQRLVQKEATRIKKELYILGVQSRNLERSRKKVLKGLSLDDIGASHLFIPVPDPEQIAKEAELAGLVRIQLLGETEYVEAGSNSSSEESEDSVTFFLGD